MKRLLILISVLLFFSSPSLFSQAWRGTAITDPSISSRCHSLLEELKAKREYSLKLKALKARNENLQQVGSKKRPSIFKNLKRHHLDLVQEVTIAKEQLSAMKEDIVRKGCPGIRI